MQTLDYVVSPGSNRYLQLLSATNPSSLNRMLVRVMILYISIDSDVSLTLNVLFQLPPSLQRALAQKSSGQARIPAITGYCDAAHGLDVV